MSEQVLQDRVKLVKLIYQRIFICQIVLMAACALLVVALTIFTSQLGSFIFAFLFGCFGGSISLLRRLRRETAGHLELLTDSWISTCMPLLFGGIMAGVTYMLFMSGILTGDGGNGLFTSNLFPNFTHPPQPEGELLSLPYVLSIRPSNIADAGKLLVWCFIAGYSEKFVKTILGALEDRVGGQDKIDKDAVGR